jgi:hypothetical protein
MSAYYLELPSFNEGHFNLYHRIRQNIQGPGKHMINVHHALCTSTMTGKVIDVAHGHCQNYASCQCGLEKMSDDHVLCGVRTQWVYTSQDAVRNRL